MKLIKKVGAAGAVTLALLFSFIFTQALMGQGRAVAAGEPDSERYVTIDFNDVDINLFIKFISELTGRNFIVDRSVKGNVSIISPTKISEKDAYQVFLSVLDVHGYTTIPSGSVTKIMPAVQARTRKIDTIRDGIEDSDDRVVTQLFQLTHADPDDIKKILAPLVSSTSVLIAHAESGMLIITDAMSNLQRLDEIIKVLDVPSIDQDLEVIALQNATAQNVAGALSQLFVQPRGRKAATDQTKIIAYERSNSLVVLASKTNLLKIRDIVARLDTEVPKGEGRIQVYYLQHANAEELVKVLTSLATAEQTAPTKGKAPLLSKDLNVMADTATNSLIIIAARDEYSIIENVIAKLDIPRRMVYIEALIMEVKVDKSFEIGVQWGGGGSYHDGTGSVYSGFSGSSSDPYSTLLGLSAEEQSYPAGFMFGVLKEGVKIGDFFFPNLGAVLNAFKDDSDVNIIATPQILTTDNQAAKIQVGENVPYITSLNTTDSAQDYTNYEYRDVSTTLEITPQINQEDLVKLVISTEVIKLKDPSSSSPTPTTLKRTAQTTVIIRDRETVVIGGIIGQDNAKSEYKVPLLGDIPVLGWLFKSHNQSDQRTNLFIFITPHIVENPAEMASLYQRKREALARASLQEEEFTGWEPAPTLDARRSRALSDIGFAKLQGGQYGEAQQYFIEALRYGPDNAHALLNMGLIYERQGQVRKAAAMYRNILEQEEKIKAAGEEGDSYLLDMARENYEKITPAPSAPEAP